MRASSMRFQRSCRPSLLRWISFGHVEADECGAIEVLSPMHGPSQQAGGADSLRSLAGLLDERLARGTGVS
jgi:hypothetical protein